MIRLASAARRQRSRMWSSLRQAIHSVVRAARRVNPVPAKGHSADEGLTPLPFRSADALFQWAVSVSDRRVLTLQGKRAIVPLSHGMGYEPRRGFREAAGGSSFLRYHGWVSPSSSSSSSEEEELQLQVRADRPFSEGAMLVEDYGDVSSYAYVQQGFAPAPDVNPFDCVRLPFPPLRRAGVDKGDNDDGDGSTAARWPSEHDALEEGHAPSLQLAPLPFRKALLRRLRLQETAESCLSDGPVPEAAQAILAVRLSSLETANACGALIGVEWDPVMASIAEAPVVHKVEPEAIAHTCVEAPLQHRQRRAAMHWLLSAWAQAHLEQFPTPILADEATWEQATDDNRRFDGAFRLALAFRLGRKRILRRMIDWFSQKSSIEEQSGDKIHGATSSLEGAILEVNRALSPASGLRAVVSSDGTDYFLVASEPLYDGAAALHLPSTSCWGLAWALRQSPLRDPAVRDSLRRAGVGVPNEAEPDLFHRHGSHNGHQNGGLSSSEVDIPGRYFISSKTKKASVDSDAALLRVIHRQGAQSAATHSSSKSTEPAASDDGLAWLTPPSGGGLSGSVSLAEALRRAAGLRAPVRDGAAGHPVLQATWVAMDGLGGGTLGLGGADHGWVLHKDAPGESLSMQQQGVWRGCEVDGCVDALRLAMLAWAASSRSSASQGRRAATSKQHRDVLLAYSGLLEAHGAAWWHNGQRTMPPWVAPLLVAFPQAGGVPFRVHQGKVVHPDTNESIPLSCHPASHCEITARAWCHRYAHLMAHAVDPVGAGSFPQWKHAGNRDLTQLLELVSMDTSDDPITGAVDELCGPWVARFRETLRGGGDQSPVELYSFASYVLVSVALSQRAVWVRGTPVWLPLAEKLFAFPSRHEGSAPVQWNASLYLDVPEQERDDWNDASFLRLRVNWDGLGPAVGRGESVRFPLQQSRPIAWSLHGQNEPVPPVVGPNDCVPLRVELDWSAPTLAVQVSRAWQLGVVTLDADACVGPWHVGEVARNGEASPSDPTQRLWWNLVRAAGNVHTGTAVAQCVASLSAAILQNGTTESLQAMDAAMPHSVRLLTLMQDAVGTDLNASCRDCDHPNVESSNDQASVDAAGDVMEEVDERVWAAAGGGQHAESGPPARLCGAVLFPPTPLQRTSSPVSSRHCVECGDAHPRRQSVVEL